MEIKQIRNATIRVLYAGKTFLIDPWLLEKGRIIDWRCKKSVLERIGQGRLLVADCTRDNADDAVAHHSGGKFATSKHKVTDAIFLVYKVFANAIVYALVVSAEDNNVFHHAYAIGFLLLPRLTVGRSVNYKVIVALFFQIVDAVVDRLYHHHHASLAAKGVVVNLLVTTKAVLAQVVNMNFGNSLVGCPLDYRIIQRSIKDFGKNGYNVNSHKLFLLSRGAPRLYYIQYLYLFISFYGLKPVYS